MREHLDRAFVIMTGAVFAEAVVPKLRGEGRRQVGHDCFDRFLVLILSSNDVGQQLFDLSSRRHATATAVRMSKATEGADKIIEAATMQLQRNSRERAAPAG